MVEKQLITRYGSPNTMDVVISAIGVILVIEAARRTVGTIFSVIVSAFVLYGYLGPYMTGFLRHRGMDFAWLFTHLFLTREGVFTTPLGVSATFVFLFIIFRSVLHVAGGGQVFIDLSVSLLGKVRGGPAKVAIFASGLMGMINGSPVANVASTGILTIPLMKRIGYKKEFAGAVEAEASSGRAIAPPVMGAAAFSRFSADSLFNNCHCRDYSYNNLLRCHIFRGRCRGG